MPGQFKFLIFVLLCSLVTPDKTPPVVTRVWGTLPPAGRQQTLHRRPAHPVTIPPSSTPTHASMVPFLTATSCGCALYCVVRYKEQQEPEKDECGEGIWLCPLIFPARNIHRPVVECVVWS